MPAISKWITLCLLKCDSKEKAIERIKEEIDEALLSLFPSAEFPKSAPEKAIQLLNRSEKATFVFVIDEWDYLLRNHREDSVLFDDYILFLRSLFKNSAISSAIDLCYMTGIMPIKRYGSMSALNEFKEYTMLNPGALAPYYGFTELEAKETILQSKTRLSLEELKEWYDGYYFSDVGEIYCPNSLINACIDNQCRPYFGETIADEAITSSLCNNKISLSAEAALLFEGSSIKITNPNSFSGDLSNLDSKDKGLIALVHSGFLLFDIGSSTVRIPNKEVRIKFSDALASLRWNNLFDGLYASSKALLDAFLTDDALKATSILDEFHYPLAGPFHHASEDNFAICVKAILYDNGKYDALSETYMGYGRADLVYLPHPDVAKTLPAIIVELKIDKNIDEALSQIEERRYYASLKGYKDNILIIGINYDTKTKSHQVKMKRLGK